MQIKELQQRLENAEGCKYKKLFHSKARCTFSLLLFCIKIASLLLVVVRCSFFFSKKQKQSGRWDLFKKLF